LRLGSKRLGELYSGIGALVAVSTLTTTAGYAGMLFTTHLGIASIGKFAVLGLLVLLGTSLCLTPWLAMKLLPEPEEAPATAA
jgi:predicted exporter